MESWKKSFLDKLGNIQDSYATNFEKALDDFVTPAFEDLSAFVRDNGFKVSVPLREQGRRSFKFELSENAYTLVIFRFTGIGEFEVRTETFVPGFEPMLKKAMGRCTDIDEEWSVKQFQKALDALVEHLANQTAPSVMPPASGKSNKTNMVTPPNQNVDPLMTSEEEEFVSV